MNTEENEGIFDGSELFDEYLKDSGYGYAVEQLLSGMQNFESYYDEEGPMDGTCSEVESNIPTSVHELEPIQTLLVEPQISTTPTMNVYVTAYYKSEKGENEFYLPRERDLILSLFYSPQNYWITKQVSFPSDPKESFYVKKKDPEHLGEIILNSEMNVHAISIEKTGTEARDDALRKRKQRTSNDDDSGEDVPEPASKRKRMKVIKEEEVKEEVEPVVSKCDRTYKLRVCIGDDTYSRTFEIRTARDLNKYRDLVDPDSSTYIPRERIERASFKRVNYSPVFPRHVRILESGTLYA